MTARDKDFTALSGGGPGGPADAGERNLAPGTQSPHAPASAQPAMGSPRIHESARAQVAGAATYVDDIPEARGTLHAAPILSTVAHGRLRGVDASAALALAGVRGVVLAGDVPGDPVLATFVHDEPIFARDTVQHVGQVIGLVVADNALLARRAARRVKLDIEPLPAVLDVRQAHAAQSYVLPKVVVRRGDPEAALAASPHTLHGQLEVGGQEHFYLEGQVAYALPQEQDQWRIYSSTQHPGEVQHWVAHALNLENNAVTVECRRMGGGFGGKETQAGHMAVWAALAARKLGRPVKLRMDRDDDFLVTGKRHPFAYDWQVGFDDTGLITALKLTMLANCGFSADLSGPVADRAIFHVDNAYFLSDVQIESYRCKTNIQSHTAFRGFGGPQGVILIEAVLGEVARHLGLDPFDVRLRNLYGVQDRHTTHYQMRVEDNILRPLMTQLAQDARYAQRRAEIAAWNAQSPVIQRGIALTPVKFGISFTATFFNQAGRAGARVHRRQRAGQPRRRRDGPGPAHQDHADRGRRTGRAVRARAHHRHRHRQGAQRLGHRRLQRTDLNGRAAQYAARNIRGNLAAFVAGLDGCGAGAVTLRGGKVISPKATREFDEVVKLAYANRIQLWSDGFYRTPKIHYDKTTLTGRPFYYFSYGAACSEVAIDTLTGESRVLAVDILHDVGASINPAIDIGQIEGGFIQGMGWLTTEQLAWNEKGQLTTHAPSTYKIPATGDVPAHFKVALWPEANREDNVGGSKAVGEPPLMLAISVWEALRDAVASRSGAAGAARLVAPATAENVLKALAGLPGA